MLESAWDFSGVVLARNLSGLTIALSPLVPNLPNAPLCKRGRARNKGDP